MMFLVLGSLGIKGPRSSFLAYSSQIKFIKPLLMNPPPSISVLGVIMTLKLLKVKYLPVTMFLAEKSLHFSGPSSLTSLGISSQKHSKLCFLSIVSLRKYFCPLSELEMHPFSLVCSK